VLKPNQYNRKFIKKKKSLIKKLTSCGGTLNVAVRKSTLIIVSTHGKIKNKPGPFAPPKKKKEYLNFLYMKITFNLIY
jgi:hypothetical protein